MNKKRTGAALNRISENEFAHSPKVKVIVVLDNIRSGLNVGSVFRTSDAFRLEAVYLCGITAAPPQKDILKSSLGAEKTVKWSHFNDTSEAVEILKEQGYLICSIEQTDNSTMLHSFKTHGEHKYAVIFGNEVRGVSQEIINQSDVCLEIPMEGTKHSLNVSVCAGIVLWHFFSELSLSEQ